MKKTILMITLVCIAAALQAQVTASQLKGVWTITALGKAGEDSVVTFEKDSVISGLFKNKTFTDVNTLSEKAKTQEDKMAFMFLGLMKGMFVQFDGTTVFAEGMIDEKKAASKVKRGTYKVNGSKVTTSTNKDQEFTVEMKGDYLMVTSDSGMVMYMKKISDTLY